ncbi:MAG: AAA family ATPase [Methylobacter sp.]
MKIKSLRINNFLVIGQADLNLDSRGLLLVQGVNDADSSANSNGAGKSSIVDAISWCLYGETARGETGDEVVNHSAGKDCKVRVDILDGESLYRIIRHRKHNSKGNSLLVLHHPKHDDMLTYSDLSKGTDKLTQEVVSKIVGCSYEVFIAAVYSGQEQMPDLPGMTDKQLKLIVEEAAGIERLQAAHDIAVLKNKMAQADVDRAKQAIKDKSSMLELFEQHLKDFEEKQERFKLDTAFEVSGLVVKLKAAKEGLVTMPFMSKIGREMAVSKMADIMTQISDSQGEEKAQLEAVDGAIKAHERSVWERGVDVKLKTDEVRKLKSSLDKVEERVGTPCSECGKDYHEEDITEARANITKNLKEALLFLKTLKERKEDAEKLLNIALTTRKDFIASMTDVSMLLKRHSELQSDVAESDKRALEYDRAVAETDALKSQIKTLQDRELPYRELIEEKKREVEAFSEQKESLTADLVKFEAALETTVKAVDVFGRAGVRAHILDTVTPFLNERTAEYLGTLTDGNIVASWSTLGKTAKGELREKFAITASKHSGSKTFRGLSGGEKRKVRLSTAMALQDLVASRVTKPIEFQLYDEVDDALDVSGLERLMTIMDKRGREKGTVLVISHNDLADYISNSIVVTNKGGVSEITDG